MRKRHYNLLTIAILSSFYSHFVFADFKSQCLVGVPQFAQNIVNNNDFFQPVYIDSDNAVVNYPNNAVYSGNVHINQGNRIINTDQVEVEFSENRIQRSFIPNYFSYKDHLIQATGNGAVIDLRSKHAELYKTNYQLVGRLGRGNADSVWASNDKRIMKNATFTSCVPNNNAWSIEANEMIQYVKQDYAELWGAKFKIFNIPIFYSPYLQFPIGDRRRSGILIPNIGHSNRDGYFYSQPFYWNIAPNLDMTITPTFYTKRGWQLSPEIRYLTQIGEGQLAAEYMREDKFTDYLGNNKNRYLFFWNHNSNFSNHWYFSTNYTRVSDRHYFSDFNSIYGNSTDGYAIQKFTLGYVQPNYNISINAKRFQTFDTSKSNPYQVFPQININYYQNRFLNNADFSFFSQLSYFTNKSKHMPTAWRLHIEPLVSIPVVNRYARFNLETKLYGTYYWQYKGKTAVSESLEKNIYRMLPQLKLDLETRLETSQIWDKFIQTLEPRIQYLYRPYRNQRSIGTNRQNSLGLGYDSALLQQTYFSLFHDRRYSGLDRIASANQITVGGTTRYFTKDTGEEVFNLSAGQIYYIRPSRVDNNSINSTTKRSSSWSIESNWKFKPNWNWFGSYQYDTRLNKTALANMSLQFKPKKDYFMQLNYHYASKSYINQNLSSNLYDQNIKQLGGIISWKLRDNFSLVTSHYQDIALKKPVESQINIIYTSCCWSANLYLARHLTATPNGKPDGINNVYYDNRLGLNFELNFGGNYGNSSEKMLKRGLIPYTDRF